MKKEAMFSTLYDSIELTSPGLSSLFVYPVGISGKSWYDTNMYYAGMLPAGREFTVETLKIKCEKPTFFQFVIGACVYGEFKLWGENSFDLKPLFLASQQYFCWRVESDFYPQRVFVTMCGTLTRVIE